MTITRLTPHGIAEVVTGYLGDEEDDLIFKRPVLQRLFLDVVTTPSLNWRLNWEQRPERIQQEVTSLFQSLEKFTQQPDFWLTFGKAKYNLCKIDEALLMKAIILQAYPKQKEFWFVDIGAGNFQCGQHLSNYLNQQTDLPQDILVNIVGLRGERYTGPGVIKFGICKEIRLGGFRIEDITTEFERCKLPKGSIDLAVSAVTIVHLADRPGTLAQIHDLLQPGTGLLSTDRFNFFSDESGYSDDHHDEDSEAYMLFQLLLDTGSPFIAACTRQQWGRACQGFFLKRLGSDPCCLPMRYLPVTNGVAKFSRGSPFENPWRIDPVPQNGYHYYGSKSLFDWIQTSSPSKEPRIWKPIQPLPLQ